MIRALKLLFAVFAFCFISVNAAGFSDVNSNAEYASAVYKMQEMGYIQGFEDGTFRPNASLSRAEFVTIINKMYKYTEKGENIFSDVLKKDWFYNDVLSAVQAGYISGMGNGMFKPSDKVSREQVCVMLNRILNMQKLPFSETVTDSVSGWAKESVEILLSNHLFSLEAGGKFRAKEPITRSEACVALAKCVVDVNEEFEVVSVENMAREELEKRLSGVIDQMEKNVIPACSTEGNKKVAVMITDNLKKYLEDPSYDYKAGTKETFDVYKTVPKAERDELRGHIYKYIDTNDLMLLYDFFYDSDINSVIHGSDN